LHLVAKTDSFSCAERSIAALLDAAQLASYIPASETLTTLGSLNIDYRVRSEDSAVRCFTVGLLGLVLVTATLCACRGGGSSNVPPLGASQATQPQTKTSTLPPAVSSQPKIEIKDVSQNGSPTVSGSPPPPQTTIIGKKVALEVEVVSGTAAGYSLASETWTIQLSPEAVSSYALNAATPAYVFNLAAPSPLPSTLQGTNVTFYWIQGGTATVSVVATLINPAIGRVTL